MKSRFKNTFGPARTRPSRILCQEKLACRGPACISIIYCEGCRSYQCELCDTVLHSDTRFSLHVKNPIIPTASELLCDGDCTLKNFADVNCSLCKAKFCYHCDRLVHSYLKKSTHMRTKIKDEDEFLSCEGECYIEEEESSSSTENMMNAEDLPDLLGDSILSEHNVANPSVLLLNDKEQLQITSSDVFAEKLKCDKTKLLKVVAIFGNTGVGKSHTLNHAFFDGKYVFKTSPLQISCTAGVWAAYSSKYDILTLDTEGFLGQTSNDNQRARMLLKILAISDVIIYRTRADRLTNDMYKFLGDASEAYTRHFAKELKDACERCNITGSLSALGPAVVIFHETCNTEVLSKNAVQVLKNTFEDLHLKLDAFSDLQYVGIKTQGVSLTNFQPLLDCVEPLITNSSIRSARSVDVIFKVLKALNDKFCIGLDASVPNTFPDQYFTCPVCCQSCHARCTNSMNHLKNDIPHHYKENCSYQYQFQNQIFLCKKCYEDGNPIVVAPQITESDDSSWWDYVKYATSGYLIKCPKCGIIYRSYEHWYGNKDPRETCVQTQICHVWPDDSKNAITNPNTARYILDGLTAVTHVVSDLGTKPTKMIASWAADQIAPSYWVPNSQVTECKCKLVFNLDEEKHHCRKCGQIFCNECTRDRQKVHGWGDGKVRVCKECSEAGDPEALKNTPPSEITVRRISEAVCSTIGTVATVVNYPIGVLKETARPDYWIPDHILEKCCVCTEKFGPKRPIHHCRDCGDGVCDECGQNYKKVPSRGWTTAVRICNNCMEKPEYSDK